jgi:hypothetical protein
MKLLTCNDLMLIFQTKHFGNEELCGWEGQAAVAWGKVRVLQQELYSEALLVWSNNNNDYDNSYHLSSFYDGQHTG